MPRRSVLNIILTLFLGHVMFAQTDYSQSDQIVMVSKTILSQYERYTPNENCSNGIDDDNDGLIDCADGDCQVLNNGGFEDVPTVAAPNSYVTFPPYPTFMGSWAAVNIDGEVFYQSNTRPAFQGDRYASLLQNAGANPRQPWNETSWGAGGYDRFLFIANTFPLTDYDMVFYHASDNRYAYYGDRTLVQIQSLDTDYFFDTLITTPALFDWTQVELPFSTDSETNSVAILFSSYSNNSSSVLVDALKLCGARVPQVEAVDDVATVPINEFVEVEVLANDINLPESGLTISTHWSGYPSNGSVVVNPSGTITYTPDVGYTGLDSFNYQICNTQSVPHLCDIATVYINVVDFSNFQTDTFSIVILEDESGQICETFFELNNVESVFICQDGSYGSCQIDDFPCVDYYPHPDYFGGDTICVVSCDNGICDTSVFAIEIQPVNDNPNAQDDAASTMEETPVVFSILDNDFDLETTLDISGVSILDEPDNGQVILGPGNSLTYIPDDFYMGSDTLIYLVCDNGQPSLCDWAQVIIQVHPELDTTWLSIEEDNSLVICADTIYNVSTQSVGQSSYFIDGNGQANEMESQCIDYDPVQDYNGMDTVLIVNCVAGQCDTTVHVIQIFPVNDPPVVLDDAGQTDENTNLIIDVVVNDSDPIDLGDVDPSSVEILLQPGSGDAIPQHNGTILYIPNSGFTGNDIFTYVVCDLGTPMPALCDTAMVEVMVGQGDENVRCMIPESFSPNGDGLYDRFNIECAAYYPEMELYIYDRFGNQMYQSEHGYQNDWDGTSMNNHKPLREGTYFWVVFFNDSHTKDRAGYVLIWR